MRPPGIEPGSTAWKATMLTTISPTLGAIVLLTILLEFCRPVVVCLRMKANRANMAGNTKFVPQLSVKPRSGRESALGSSSCVFYLCKFEITHLPERTMMANALPAGKDSDSKTNCIHSIFTSSCFVQFSFFPLPSSF